MIYPLPQIITTKPAGVPLAGDLHIGIDLALLQSTITDLVQALNEQERRLQAQAIEIRHLKDHLKLL